MCHNPRGAFRNLLSYFRIDKLGPEGGVVVLVMQVAIAWLFDQKITGIAVFMMLICVCTLKTGLQLPNPLILGSSKLG